MFTYTPNQYSSGLLDLAKQIVSAQGDDKDTAINTFKMHAFHLMDNKAQENLSHRQCTTAVNILVKQLKSPVNAAQSANDCRPLYLAEGLTCLVNYTMQPGVENPYVYPAVAAIMTRATRDHKKFKNYQPNIYRKAGDILYEYGKSFELEPEDAIALGDIVLEAARPEYFHQKGKTTPFNSYMDAVQRHPQLPYDIGVYFICNEIGRRGAWGDKILPLIEGYQAMSRDMNIKEAHRLASGKRETMEEKMKAFDAMDMVRSQREYYETMNHLMKCFSVSVSLSS